MKLKNYFCTTLLLAFIFFTENCYSQVEKFSFLGIRIELIDSTQGAIANRKSDEYTKSLTAFDLQIRLDQETGAKEADYLTRSATQMKNWSVAQKEIIKKSFGEIEAYCKTNNINLELPETIQMISTGGKEEFEAEGYTRENRIMLCIKPGQELSTHLIAHELFHIYSRHQKEMRDKIYAVFGFKKCNRVNIASALDGKSITNPDCPFIEHYIRLEKDGKYVDAVLVLYSKKAYYQGYAFGDNLDVALLQLTGNEANKIPKRNGDKAELSTITDFPDFLNR